MKTLNRIFICTAMAFTGCSERADVSHDATVTATVDTRYVVDVEPADAVPVGTARESSIDAEMLTLVGTIGGSKEPFVEGLAAFTIVDPKVPFCAPEEGCPTPWDYCCKQAQVKENIATVKIVDDAGEPVAIDAKKLLGVKELSTVVVQGEAERDEQGNLTIAATKVFVRPSE